MRYFLAGGAVRDILLGRIPTDFDIVFEGTPRDLTRLHGNVHKVGSTVATYIINGYDYTPLTTSIPENLLARDCTINALLIGENGIIHALPQTFADLRDGILRHVSAHSFLDDPVRIFRVARFMATLPCFSIAAETTHLMIEATAQEKLQTIAAERISKECMKAMAGYKPGNFLLTLSQTNALHPWFSPWEKGIDPPTEQDQHHGNNNVLDHTLDVMNNIAAMPLPDTERTLAVWMGLCHDLGKLTTLPELLPRHIEHTLRGEYLARELALRLRLPRRWQKAGCLAALLHMKAARYTTLCTGAKVMLLQTLAANQLAVPFIAMIVASTSNTTLHAIMMHDLQTILAVSLPEKWRNKGVKSASKLYQLRIAALNNIVPPVAR